jgi:tetratricopeptide (TPR) repeat protein
MSADTFARAARSFRDGDMETAERICLTLLDQESSRFAASHLLGLIALRLERPEQALRWIGMAIEQSPDQPEPWYNRAQVMTMLERREEALADYDRAIALKPHYLAARNNRGNLLRVLGLPARALRDYDAILAHDPMHGDACNNRGATLVDLGRFEEATASFERALALQPTDAAARANLARVLRERGRIAAAGGLLERAVALCDQASTLLPDDADETKCRSRYRVALGLRQLSAGDYPNGWRNFEARWPAEFAIMRRAFATRAWTGDEPIDGKTILVHAEGGFGDTLQFCRYAPMLAKHASVILDVPRPLVRLLSGLRGIHSVISQEDPTPAFDVWTPMMSLPLAFGTTAETIPASVPYLNADSRKTADWHQRLAGSPGYRIGLVWAGAPRSDRPDVQPWSVSVDLRRSISLHHFAPLGAIPGLSLISLQKGQAAGQTLTPPDGMRLLDRTDELRDFADTAALVAALDLVISVDTAVVHLAGALGKPVWVLNRYDQCWRWLRDRTDSPWYPTARLFQQRAPGDWDGVMRDVVAALGPIASASIVHRRHR